MLQDLLSKITQGLGIQKNQVPAQHVAAPSIDQVQGRSDGSREIARSLAFEVKTPVNSTASLESFIDNVAPRNEGMFALLPVEKFFAQLKTLASQAHSQVQEYLNFGVDLSKIASFDLFKTVMDEIRSRLAPQQNLSKPSPDAALIEGPSQTPHIQEQINQLSEQLTQAESISQKEPIAETAEEQPVLADQEPSSISSRDQELTGQFNQLVA